MGSILGIPGMSKEHSSRERVQNRKYLFSDKKKVFIVEKFSFLYIYKFE